MNQLLLRVSCVAAATLSSVHAQVLVRFVDGLAAGDAMGRAVHAAGDVNGDGLPDFIVGLPNNDFRGVDAGMARVISGADGSLLHRFVGGQSNYRLGTSVSGAGDVNGDGFADLIVGSIGDTNNANATGSARVFSGADGSLLQVFFGDRPYTFFGNTVRAAGDVNADGFDDVIVGVPPLIGSGSGLVYSGRDGALLHQFLVLGRGEVVDGAGDANGDGYADLVVGRPNDEVGGLIAGNVAVFSGRDRSMLWELNGVALDQLGAAVAGVGDVNGDGFDDIAVGATQILSGGTGYVLVLSGSDGSTIHALAGVTGADQFGTSVAGIGDVDGDGVGEIAVGIPGADANGAEAGAARVLSGATGGLLGTVNGDSAGDLFGSAVSLVGDSNGDGLAELLVGAPSDDDAGLDAGRASLFELGFVATPGREFVYGKACPSSDGRLPRIDYRGDAGLGHTIEVRLRGAAPNAAVVANLGDPYHLPLDLYGLVGCTIYADPNGYQLNATTDVDGLCRQSITIPAGLTALVGIRYDLQWVVLDPPANAWGITFSNALALTFGS